MEFRSLGFQFRLDDLLRVVPGASGIRHKDRLIKAEKGNRDQISNEEVRFKESETERREENSQEDVEHSLLRILRADFDDLFRIADRSFGRAFQLDVGLDKFHSAISTSADCLRGRTGKPIDDGTAGNQTKQERWMKNRDITHQAGLKAFCQCKDNGENHRRRADNSRTD